MIRVANGPLIYSNFTKICCERRECDYASGPVVVVLLQRYVQHVRKVCKHGRWSGTPSRATLVVLTGRHQPSLAAHP